MLHALVYGRILVQKKDNFPLLGKFTESVANKGADFIGHVGSI
jgi:hypothetical protein